MGEEKRRGPRYTPLSKRQDRPAAILWLVKFHPELSDGQIGKLVGTTKPTIQSIRERTPLEHLGHHADRPGGAGPVPQSELDAAVQVAARKKAADGAVMSDDERRKLVSTEQSLGMATEPEDAVGPVRAGSLRRTGARRKARPTSRDADSFFNLPQAMTTTTKTKTTTAGPEQGSVPVPGSVPSDGAFSFQDCVSRSESRSCW